ncbi:fimbrillin family protein [Prevotella sp. P3-120]|uniref:fimbrillin family protein n=2 Tax=unclassified Prevotella TaxID=2638335 RepID=UPI00117CB4FE|nr:fimbrillin family protein [Prevotella sp. P3-120]
MKKYIQSMMAFAAIVSFASCSSEDNNTTIENESAVKVMTFTATQEGNEASTRAILSGTNIHWVSEDEISIFDGTNNNQFTLTDGAGSTSGKFSGEAGQSTSYTAVYPYQSTASLSGNGVTKVTLPATQTATDNSFDKNAALMMAQSNSNTLNFKNVVGYVKVKPTFNCTRIDLKAFDNSAVLAGTGTVSYNNGKPTLDLSETKDYAITLRGDIKANKYYYIAVPPVTLKAGWTIQFTASDGKVYSRKGTNDITFTRNKVTNLGVFDINGTNWYNPRGDKVRADQEVDLGLTINIGTKNYKVIFAKSNLTAAGLAASEYDYGDYFAWGATEPWYKSYTIDVEYCPTVTSDGWKDEHKSGYADGTAPTFSRKYTSGQDFEMSDDPARKILGGDWQLPTKEIWEKLTSSYNWTWNDEISTTRKKGMEVKNKSTSKSIFLPAAGYVNEKSFVYVRSYGYYWSGTAGIWSSDAYRLYFANSRTPDQSSSYRFFGCSVRPVRLVPVD